MWPGNFSLDTILTVGWANFTTDDWAETYTFEEWYYPLSEQAFIVFTDSGTMMVLNVDYTYNDSTHTITFTNPLASSEHAYIWVMFDNGSWETEIGSWIITVKAWDIEKEQWVFNVNQPWDQTIDIWNNEIVFHQLWKENQTISTNQQTSSDIYFQWSAIMTQEEYNSLLPWAATDWNFYFIEY
jgi:hypothetical protein